MSEVMKTISFEKIIELALDDYYTKGKIFERMHLLSLHYQFMGSKIHTIENILKGAG